MGEIKSTIDLVMEKTQGLTLSEEEKRALEAEEETRSAKILARRYLQGDLTFKELHYEWENFSEARQTVLLRAVVGGMQLGSEAFSRGLEALEHWKGRDKRSMIRRARDLSLKFGHALQKRRRKIKAELWAELAQQGIEGSAVEPNVEVSPRWSAAMKQLELEFDARLDELKKALLT
jgi:hypothetical protein